MSYSIAHSLLIVFAVLTMAAPARAAAFGDSSIGKQELLSNYEALKAKIHSSAPLAEKMAFIKTQDQNYIQIFRLMKNEVIKNKTLADHPDYRFAVELYDQYVPLISLKLEADGKKLVETSCMEAQSLVLAKDRELPMEDGEDIRLGAESMTTAELLKKLCN